MLKTTNDKSEFILKVILASLLTIAAGLAVADIAIFINNTNRSNDSLQISNTENIGGKDSGDKEDIEPTGEILEFQYVDDIIPPTTYAIKLNLGSGELQLDEYASCSAEDCEGARAQKKITLTDDEIEKIQIITGGSYNEKDLIDALVFLVYGEEVLVTKDTSGWEHYDINYNLDGDDIITYREIGNAELNMLIESQNSH